MKAHFGVDSRSKLIHAVVPTPANVADSTMLPDLLQRCDQFLKLKPLRPLPLAAEVRATEFCCTALAPVFW
jgi:hypothetical protein